MSEVAWMKRSEIQDTEHNSSLNFILATNWAEKKAQAEAAEVLRLNPRFSLEVHKQRSPIKDPAVLERHIDSLRKAGLQ
jgi:hypothetical protein